jgi:hypothetical protein
MIDDSSNTVLLLFTVFFGELHMMNSTMDAILNVFASRLDDAIFAAGRALEDCDTFNDFLCSACDEGEAEEVVRELLRSVD